MIKAILFLNVGPPHLPLFVQDLEEYTENEYSQKKQTNKQKNQIQVSTADARNDLFGL